MKSFLLIPLMCLSLSCMKTQPISAPQEVPIGSNFSRHVPNEDKHRLTIDQHVLRLTHALVTQPVMTPREGFSGYLAHFQVIRTTTQESPFAVIVDGEGYDRASTPPELQAFVDLKGAHPRGGTYAFSGSDISMGSKARNDPQARMVIELPGPKGDGLMTIGFPDEVVSHISSLPDRLDDKDIQSILSERGQPSLD